MRYNFDARDERCSLEKSEGWQDIDFELIPFISLGERFVIKVIPPFGGALCRFFVSMKDEYGDLTGHVSVYLDWFGRFGSSDGPFWEVYPNEDGNNERFDLDDSHGLQRCIKCSLLTQAEKNR